MNARQIWRLALGELQLQVTKANYETWVKNTTVVSFTDDEFVLGAPNTFAKEWLETRFRPQISQVLAGIIGRPVNVHITVAGRQGRARVVETPLEAAAREMNEASEPAEEPPLPEPEVRVESRDDAYAEDGFATGYGWSPNPRYTFDNFVQGKSNELAFSAARAVADAPAAVYNPLFIYGGVGLGKTHLLHAIAHQAIRSGLKVLYVSSERFTNDMVNAILKRRNQEFRSHYRNMDILLIDDIQFIAGKEGTQEEFFHTFNTLHDANKQIVLSSDRPPKAIVTLEERLRSRFEWGLLADIQPPDLETREAILRQKAQTLPVHVPDQVLTFIAQRVQRNIRELEGSLNRVIAFAATTRPQGQVSVDVAIKALSDIIASPARRFLTSGQVVEASARYYRIDPRDIRGKKRDKELVLARQVAMYLMREETDSSLLDIGRELGGRDHTTVLHGYEKIKGEINVDDRLRQDVLAIREMLYNAAPKR